VLDASHPRVMEFYNTTMKVLADLDADTKQMLVVFNKMDKVEDPATRAVLRRHFPEAVFISVHDGEGIDELVHRISDFVSAGTEHVDLRLPIDRADLLARLHREGAVEQVDYENDFIRVRATISDRVAQELTAFKVKRAAAPVASR
jgi:GTP-binding protein HflX